MGIESTSGEEIDRFRERVVERLADQGGNAGLGVAEAFRLMPDL
jgi:hypothetical protein